MARARKGGARPEGALGRRLIFAAQGTATSGAAHEPGVMRTYVISASRDSLPLDGCGTVCTALAYVLCCEEGCYGQCKERHHPASRMLVLP